MKKRKKGLLGGVIGYAIAGPAGAVLGASIGHHLGKEAGIDDKAVQQIRTQIEEARELETTSRKARDRLRELLCTTSDVDRADKVVDFMDRYIGTTPDLLENMMTISQGTGVESEILGLLRSVVEYLEDPDNLIPDSEGLIGLLDDAYFAQRLIERAIGQYKEFGDAVPVTKLRLANDQARTLLGNQIGTRLDSKVEEALTHSRSAGILQSLVKNASFATFMQTWESRSVPYHGIDFKKEMIKDDIRHELAKDGIYF